MSKINFVETPKLRIAYLREGKGRPLLCLHGWPDDARTWDRVVPSLIEAGYEVIRPWLRGYGETAFKKNVLRSGQVVAFAQDAVDFLDALKIERVTFLGHDWGARTGYALAALFPERIERMTILAAGYETGIKPGNEIKLEQAEAYWYQWFWNTERGREMLEHNRDEACRYLWKKWSPNLNFTEEEFNLTAQAWQNPDWVATTLHSYRVRWGGAEPDPVYDKLEQRLREHPAIHVPTTVLHGELDGASLVGSSANQQDSFKSGYLRKTLPEVGHFIQRETPTQVIEAVLHQIKTT